MSLFCHQGGVGAGRGEAGQKAELPGPRKDVKADLLPSPCWEAGLEGKPGFL